MSVLPFPTPNLSKPVTHHFAEKARLVIAKRQNGEALKEWQSSSGLRKTDDRHR